MKTPHLILFLSLAFALAARAEDVIRYWTGVANQALYNPSNWNLVGGDEVRPSFGAAAQFAHINTDALIFDVFNEAAGSNLAGVVNVNQPLDLTAKSITLAGPVSLSLAVAGTTYDVGYDFRGANPLHLGDAFTGLTTQPNTGDFINNTEGALTLTTTGGVFFRFGSLQANGGPIVSGVNTPIDIGNGLSGAGNNLTIQAHHDVVLNGAITGLGTQETEGGHLFKTGTSRLFLNGNSVSWGGRLFISEGAVQINKSGSLGTDEGDTSLAGGEAAPVLEILGNIATPEPIQIEGRASATTPALQNLANYNILSGPVTLNAGGTEYVLQSDEGVLNLLGSVDYGSATEAATLTLRGAGAGVLAGAIGAGGDPLSVVKKGTGSWSLLGAGAFTGSISVDEGHLDLTTAHDGDGAVTVQQDASLGIILAAQNQTLDTQALSVTGAAEPESGAATLVFDLGSFPNPSVPVLSTSTLSLAQSVGVGLKAGSLSIGQIPLIDYEGALGGDGFDALSLVVLQARVEADLVDDAANTRVLLNVTGFDQPRWTGAAGADWDTAAFNWREVVSGQPTQYLQGAEGTDAVLFDDTATGPTDINLTAELTPISIRVSNDSLSYSFVGPGYLAGDTGLVKEGAGVLRIANEAENTFTGLTRIAAGTLIIGDGVNEGRGSLGSGPISNDGILVLDRPGTLTVSGAISGSGSLVKQGPGLAILSGNSDFTGLTTVTAGTLRLGTGGALGAPDGLVTVEPGATLDLRGQLLPSGKVVTVSGAGVGDAGAVINSGGGGGAAVGLRHLVFTGPSTIGGAAHWHIRDQEGGVQVNGHDLVKTGTNQVHWANLGETGIGNLLIISPGSTGGRFAVEGNTTLGAHPGVITVSGGAQLGFVDSAVVHTKPIVVEGGTLNFLGGASNHLASQITIVGDATVNTAASTETVLSGKITGNGNLVKTTGGILKITGDDNDYTGFTQNNTGPFWIGNEGGTGSLPPGDIFINAGNLLIRRWGALELGQTISGAGGFQIQNVAYPEPTAVTLSGNNSFTGTVTLARGTLRITNSSALGAGEKLVNIQGARPTLILDGGEEGLTLSPEFTIRVSSDGPLGGIQNVSGDNVIESTILLFAQGGGHGRVRGDGGSLTLNGGIRIVPYADHNGTSGNRQLQLDGDIGGVINGVVENVPEDTIDIGTPQVPNIVRRLLIVSKQGAGTWVLNAENTYEGNTLITEGTLKIGAAGSIAKTPIIRLSPGATLDVSEKTDFTLASGQTLDGQGDIVGSPVVGPGSVVVPGAEFTPGTLNITGDLILDGGGGVFSLTTATATGGGVNDLISVGGDLVISDLAPTSIELLTNGEPLGGAYTLIEYGGAFAGDVANITLVNPTRYTAELDAVTEPGKLLLIVSGAPGNLTWTGNPSNPGGTGAVLRTWNATNNFFTIPVDDLPTATNFRPADHVLFDDTAGVNRRTVVVSGFVRPASITVNTSDETGYTFNIAATINDNGIVGSSSLTKLGTGTLTFTGTSYFNATGKTTIQGGKIVISANGNGFNQTRWIELYEDTVFDVALRAAGYHLGNLPDVERVLSGNGSVLGTVLVGGISVVKPGLSSDPSDQSTAGDQIGTLTIGNLTLLAHANEGAPRLALQIGGPTGQVENVFDTEAITAFAGAPAELHDQIIITGTLALDEGSTIRLELVDDYAPALGHVFNIADWTTLNADSDGDGFGFDPLAASSFDLPELPEGLYWNRSLFLEHGLLFISQEPPTVSAIEFNPADTVNPGIVVTLSAQHSHFVSLEPYTYQWRFNGVDIAPAENATAQSPSLVLTAAEALEGEYSLVVTNIVGPGFSPAAYLSVNDPVQILAPPQNLVRDPGQPAVFSVTASGTTPLSYQWRKNGVAIPGAESDSLTLPAVTEEDEGAYDVVVSNAVGPVTAEAATLSVNDPVVIVQQPAPQGVFQGGSAAFSVQVTGTGPFAYRWLKNGVDIPGEAAAQPALVINGITEADEGAYSVRVTNSVNSVTSAAASLFVGTATPKIISLTSSKLAAAGSSVTLQVNAIGLPPLTYQWLKAGRPVKGATSATLTLPAVQLKDAGAYRVRLIGGATVESADIELGVVDAAARTVPLALGASAKLEAKAAGNGLSFAWSKDDSPLTDGGRVKGADKTVLTIGKPLADEDSGLYTLTVTGPGGSLTTAGHNLKVFSAEPVITEDPPAFPAAIVSGSFDYLIPVDPNPKKAPSAFAAKGLPPGLKLDKKTGLISGKPTAVSKDPLGYLVTLTASNSKGKATVQGRLLVQALNPALAGTYAAPVGRDAVLNGGLGGRLDLKITAKGAASGKLALGATSHTLRGALDATPGSQAGQAALTITRKGGLPPLTLTLVFDGENRITNAELSDGEAALTFAGWRNVWDRKTNQATNTFAAYHTFALEIPNHIGVADVPQGNGYGSVTLAPAGTLRLAGKLADGEAFTGSAFAGPAGELVVFQTRYKTKEKGSLAGWLDLNDAATGLGGELTWTRPANPAPKHTLYRNGFPGVVDLVPLGGPYAPPVDPQVFLNLAPGANNAQLSFADGGIEGSVADPETDLDLPVSIAAKSKAAVTLDPAKNPRKATLSLTPRTGLFKGTAQLEDSVSGVTAKRSFSFLGIAVPVAGGQRGHGYFLLNGLPAGSGTLSGQVILQAAP